jgi:hypothetical protein
VRFDPRAAEPELGEHELLAMAERARKFPQNRADGQDRP